MADIVRRTAHQTDVGNLADLYRIICHQTVTTLDKLNCGFALADTAFAGNEYAFAVDLDQNAVACDAGSKIQVQECDQTGDKVGSALLTAEQRHIVLSRQIQHFRKIRQFPCNDQCRNVAGHQSVQTLGAGFFVDRGEICKLHFTDDLHTFRIEVLIEAHELQSRTSDIVFVDQDLCGVFGHIDGFQMKFINDFS